MKTRHFEASFYDTLKIFIDVHANWIRQQCPSAWFHNACQREYNMLCSMWLIWWLIHGGTVSTRQFSSRCFLWFRKSLLCSAKMWRKIVDHCWFQLIQYWKVLLPKSSRTGCSFSTGRAKKILHWQLQFRWTEAGIGRTRASFKKKENQLGLCPCSDLPNCISDWICVSLQDWYEKIGNTIRFFCLL